MEPRRKRLIFTATLVTAFFIVIGLYLGYKKIESWIISQSQEAQGIEVKLTEVSDSEANANSLKPLNIRIVNLSESSFSVFFRTATPTYAFIQYGEERHLDSKLIDIRSENIDDTARYYNHFFTFYDPGAELDSVYQFRIIVEDYIDDNNGELYAVKLPTLLESPPAPNALLYNLILPETTTETEVEYIKQDGFIIVTGKASGVSSNLVGDSVGKALGGLDIGGMRTSDHKSYVNPEELFIEVYIPGKVYTGEILDFQSNSVYNLNTKK